MLMLGFTPPGQHYIFINLCHPLTHLSPYLIFLYFPSLPFIQTQTIPPPRLYFIIIRCSESYRQPSSQNASSSPCISASAGASTTRSTITPSSQRTRNQVAVDRVRILPQSQRGRTQGLQSDRPLRRHPKRLKSQSKLTVVGTRYPYIHAGLNELDYTELTVLVEEEFKI